MFAEEDCLEGILAEVASGRVAKEEERPNGLEWKGRRRGTLRGEVNERGEE